MTARAALAEAVRLVVALAAAIALVMIPASADALRTPSFAHAYDLAVKSVVPTLPSTARATFAGPSPSTRSSTVGGISPTPTASLVGAEEGGAAVAGEGPSGVPNFENPAASPSDGWEWRGTGEPGSTKGSWYNPETGESLHPDLGHPDPIGPHYDWKAPDGTIYRVYPDGTIVPK